MEFDTIYKVEVFHGQEQVDLKKNIAVVDVENVDDGVLADAIDSIGFEATNITEH